MKSDRWQQVEELYHAALERPAESRADFLRAACGDDEDLYREVESLLGFKSRAENFIEKPALEIAAKAVAEDNTKSVTGQQIGNFKILTPLGQGGMGEVYLAQDTKLGRNVALKFLPLYFTRDENRLRRFEQEARAASALNHPNIVTIHEIGAADGHRFIATEFIDGETLRQRMTNARVKLAEALSIAIQTADALCAAHEAGIVHRDIKPENIMLRRRDLIVKVLDFGVAKLSAPPATTIDTEARTKALLKTEPGVVMGTVIYMSPEQARGLAVDQRTDIWSLGVVLYEMVAGCLPFEGSTSSEVLASILGEKEPQPLARYSREVPAELERIVSKALRKNRDQRYQTTHDMLLDLQSLKQELEFEKKLERSVPPQAKSKATGIEASNVVAATGTHAQISTGQKSATSTGEVVPTHTASSAQYIVDQVKHHKLGMIIALAFLTLASVAAYFYVNRKPPLTEKDTILLTDFTNTTGEAAFDGTLKQALAVQLGQSPFLNILPERQVSETLRYMGRSPEERVTGEIAREVCERQGIKAMLTGSITSLGSHYVIAIEAVNCHTGESLVREQVEANNREQVLATLGKAATELRGKLGESLSLILKFNVDLTQATTSSLEAFKAYTLGREQGQRGDFVGAIPFLKRAIELDPNFAMAYANLGTMYTNLGERDLGVEYTKKAFELRERVSERERLNISSRYYDTVTGELDQSIEVMEVWKRTYPRDYTPRNNLGFTYERMGDLDKAAEEYRAAIPLSPLPAIAYQNLARVLLFLDRREEAKAVFDEAITKKLESTNLHLWLYELAFELGDAAAMQHEVEWAAGKPDEARMLWEQSAAALFEGKVAKAQELIRHASQSAASHNMKGEVAFGTALLAAHVALFGECRQASEALPAVKTAPGRSATLMLSTALALCGQNAQAKALMEEQIKRSPTDILLNNAELPLVRAVIELNGGNPARALELLRTAVLYERTRPRINYVRGMAYLRTGQPAEAAAEFQKIAGARGAEPLWPGRALAHLWLARAYGLMGDTAKSRQAYERFFALWKDADQNIPILIEAKKEYEKLK